MTIVLPTSCKYCCYTTVWNADVVVWSFTAMNSHWVLSVAHTLAQKIIVRQQHQTVNDGVAHSKNLKKVRVSRDLWPWPWPWAHPGCTLTWSPSCPSLVAIWPFVYENKRFAQKFTDGRTDRRRTPRHCISSFLEWANNHCESVTYLTASLSYRDLGRRRTGTTHHQRVGLWAALSHTAIDSAVKRVVSASTRLRSCWRWTFWAHAEIKIVWCDTYDIWPGSGYLVPATNHYFERQ